MKILFGLLLSMCAVLAQAAPIDAIEFHQRLGQQVPLQDRFMDQNAHDVALGSFFGQRPVILILGYYHCPMLCSTLMDGVLESLRGIGVDYEIVAASIDPKEKPADAARKYAAYEGLMDAGQPEHLHLLTGSPQSIVDLAQAAGFPYRYDPASGQYGHPAGFLVVTPEGHISRYFPGVRFSSTDIRLALVEASSGRIGSLADRLVLLCSHYDPRSGQYNVAVMALARGVGLAALAALVLGVFVADRRRRRTI
jgi:protein SCO1/2